MLGIRNGCQPQLDSTLARCAARWGATTVCLPWCITLDNSKGISRLRFWAKNRRVNGINDLPVFMHQGSITPHPNEQWMTQVARNVTMADVGFLSSSRYLIHDRDSKFCESFHRTIEAIGVTPVKLPARSPDLNSFAEHWVKSVKEECLSKLILFGEKSLRHALREYVVYYHNERNHQGKENLLLFPASDQLPQSERKVRSRERLGGLLRFYHREAA